MDITPPDTDETECLRQIARLIFEQATEDVRQCQQRTAQGCVPEVKED
jgi:hypothetical protein